MQNSIHGIEIPCPTTPRRRSSLQGELLGDLANRTALLRIEIKDSANHHRFVLIDLHMWRHTVTTWNAHITERGSPGTNLTTPSSVQFPAPIPFDNLPPLDPTYVPAHFMHNLQ